ncbi:MAG: hypothetical protein JSS63_09835 [Bacteroidetes bacterium]|nr:hypothetical protein [Bacteroidota bacterium]
MKISQTTIINSCAMPIISFIVKLSEDEISKFYKTAHEIKCFLLWEANKLKESSNYYYEFLMSHEENDKAIIEFAYRNKLDPNLVLYFDVTFHLTGNISFDIVDLMHSNNKHRLIHCGEKFKQQACEDVKEIINNLLSRNSAGTLCKNCVHKYTQKLYPRCVNYYTTL